MRRSSVLKKIYLLAALLGFFYHPSPAHTTRGHNVLEAAAYKNLLKKQKGEIPGFPDFSGKDILDYLIVHQILRVPPCHPLGFGGSNCQSYADNDSIPWLPVVGSGDMDAIMYRQFSKNGQYFHFMASPGAIYRNSEVDERTGAPRGLTEEAYPRAIRFITGMFYEILEKSDESKRFYRDIYSLIHTVGDSYSAAHAERDTSNWQIKYLKPWQATAWQPYLVFWSGWPYYFSDKIHWFPEDVRDKQYLRPDAVPQDEVEYYDKNPYLVPRSFLNRRGVEAAIAIEDLLLSTFAVIFHTEQDPGNHAGIASKEWQEYLNKHFLGYTDSTTVNSIIVQQAPVDEREWRPMVQVGLRTRFGTFPNSADYLLAMNFAKPPSYVDPFGFAAGYEVGRRYIGSQTLWVGSISFGLYLWQYSDILALGIDPTIADLTWDGNHLSVDPMFSLFRLDSWIERRIWLSVEAFRYSLKNGFQWQEFSLTAGLAFSSDIHLHWSDLFSPPRYLRAPSLPVGSRWKTPDVDSPQRVNPRTYGLFHPFGYGFYDDSRHIAILPVGYTFLRDLAPRAKFSRWSYGLYAGLGGEHFEDEVWAFLRLGPLLRAKLISLASLQLEPVTGKYRVGLSKNAGSSFDVDAGLGIVLMLGSFDIDVEMLRYSYNLRKLDQKMVAGIRFGILRE